MGISIACGAPIHVNTPMLKVIGKLPGRISSNSRPRPFEVAAVNAGQGKRAFMSMETVRLHHQYLLSRNRSSSPAWGSDSHGSRIITDKMLISRVSLIKKDFPSA
jgi:hypothetical protein